MPRLKALTDRLPPGDLSCSVTPTPPAFPGVGLSFLAAGESWIGPVAVSAIFSLIAMPASILGNELAMRFERHRTLAAMVLSAL
jgi:hypothetical protein